MTGELRWYDIETDPAEVVYTDDGAGQPVPTGMGLTDDCRVLPGDVQRLLEQVVADVDSHTCQANTCSNRVGHVLHDDDDDPRGNGVRWAWATVVTVGDRALVVCEDCTPSTVYDTTGVLVL